MAFKNINTAINQELGRIKATQKSYEYRHHGRPFRTEAINFQDWFLNGVRRMEAKGAEFELIDSGLVRTLI